MDKNKKTEATETAGTLRRSESNGEPHRNKPFNPYDRSSSLSLMEHQQKSFPAQSSSPRRLVIPSATESTSLQTRETEEKISVDRFKERSVNTSVDTSVDASLGTSVEMSASESAEEEVTGMSIQKKLMIFILTILLGAGGYLYFKPVLSQLSAPAVTRVDSLRFVNAYGNMFIYSGEVNSEGIPEGEGIGIYEYGIYQGTYKNGVRDGVGVYTTFYGDNRFEGIFESDAYREGKLFFKDSTYYEGTFVNNTYYNGRMFTKRNEVDYIIQN